MMLAFASGAAAQSPAQITLTDYDRVAATSAGRIDFEGLARWPEPGVSYEGVLAFAGAQVGEKLAGQQLGAAGDHDVVSGQPEVPLFAVSGGRGTNLAVAFHAGFGSNAGFPIGPRGFAKRSGRGEGAMAIVFDAPVDRFAMKIHADYPDPLGSRPATGTVTLVFYGNDGAQIGSETMKPERGVQRYGFTFLVPCKAVSITHDDPGGIAIDDIRFPLKNLNS